MEHSPPCPADDECLLFLIRHGATDNNLAVPAVLQGRGLNSELSARGRTQAQATATALAGYPIRAVYASPLLRAWQTAETIAAVHGLPVRIQEDFVEADVGQWEGRDWGEIERNDAEAYRLFMDDPSLHPYRGGETLTDVRDRALPALNRLLSNHLGGTVVAVAHNVVNRALVAHLLDMPLAVARGLRQDNCGVNLIRRRGERAALITLNSVLHLGCS